jgi:hypothetical protein
MGMYGADCRQDAALRFIQILPGHLPFAICQSAVLSSIAIGERFGTADRFLEKESVADGPSPNDGSQGCGPRIAATGVSSRGLPGLPTLS